MCCPQMREAIQVALAGIGAGFQAFLSSGQVVQAIVALFAVFVLYYLAREGMRFLIGEIQRRIGQPSLVRESSRSSRGCCSLRKLCRGKKKSAFNDVIMNPKLQERIRRMATSTRYT